MSEPRQIILKPGTRVHIHDGQETITGDVISISFSRLFLGWEGRPCHPCAVEMITETGMTVKVEVMDAHTVTLIEPAEAESGT